ncbi:MAG: hypothetical protein Q7L07_06640 [Pseudohongiella sp.]|nr:hypothetical protein [Pseudohongiella sp.]
MAPTTRIVEQRRRLNTLSMLGAMALSYVLFATVSSADQNADIPDYSIQPTPLERLRAELIESLETSGAYDYGLLEPLNNLTAALIEDESYVEANALIEQQIQVLRINDGLFTPSQIELVKQQLGVLAAEKNWDQIFDRMSYLALVLERSESMPVTDRLAHIKELRNWSRLLLARGPRLQEPNYLLQLQALEEMALEVARSSLNPGPELQQLIYERALAELYIALGIVATTDTSRQLLSRSEGIETPDYRRNQVITSVSDLEAVFGARASTVIDRSHRNVMNRHQQMIKSLADSSGGDADKALEELSETDPEQAAMIQLFIGDSVLLRQQYELRMGSHTGPQRGSSAAGSAAGYYRTAWSLLLKAGHTEQALNDYFSCPTLLPAGKFETTLAGVPKKCTTEEETGELMLPDVAIIRNGVPGLRYENLPETGRIGTAAGTRATLQFHIGMNGQADRININASVPDNAGARIQGKAALETLQFRPALRDGRPIRSGPVILKLFSLESG